MAIRCPHLNDLELCSIYENRPSCCRNFPNRNQGMFCSKTVCVYDQSGNLDCKNCKDKCCKHLEMTIFDIKLLNMSCDSCKELYCNDQNPYTGPEIVSIGIQGLSENRQSRSRKIEVTLSKKQKK